MGRNELLKQKQEKEEAIKALNQSLKTPDSIKYNLVTDAGLKAGYVEYFPLSDSIVVSHRELSTIKGDVLRSLRDILNQLLDD